MAIPPAFAGKLAISRQRGLHARWSTTLQNFPTSEEADRQALQGE